ncbi:MAG: hypothetical protein Sylvanvirus11_3 [Sylvanvirus sp.]|uniref:Uncharacterized protein n=1 Tax=Sylvanvirus sp. TaxID=2487774 RepID=A0A3G5AI37_9VIRU|nr:MAG: hypothetical protein Sylvanvirus11_3 [Sylvanvirus sp.]
MDPIEFSRRINFEFKDLDTSDYTSTFESLKKIAFSVETQVFEFNTSHSHSSSISSNHEVNIRMKFEKPKGTKYGTIEIEYIPKASVPYMYPAYQYKIRGTDQTSMLK